MNFFVSFFALVVGFVGLVSAIICAEDLRSGGCQNFNDIYAMYAENSLGGREYF